MMGSWRGGEDGAASELPAAALVATVVAASLVLGSPQIGAAVGSGIESAVSSVAGDDEPAVLLAGQSGAQPPSGSPPPPSPPSPPAPQRPTTPEGDWNKRLRDVGCAILVGVCRGLDGDVETLPVPADPVRKKRNQAEERFNDADPRRGNRLPGGEPGPDPESRPVPNPQPEPAAPGQSPGSIGPVPPQPDPPDSLPGGGWTLPPLPCWANPVCPDRVTSPDGTLLALAGGDAGTVGGAAPTLAPFDPDTLVELGAEFTLPGPGADGSAVDEAGAGPSALDIGAERAAGAALVQLVATGEVAPGAALESGARAAAGAVATDALVEASIGSTVAGAAGAFVDGLLAGGDVGDLALQAGTASTSPRST